MPRYMLDTNICIYLIKNQPPQVARRFAACRAGDVVMSAITFAELDYGVVVSSHPAHERRVLCALIEQIPVAPFDGLAASAYGAIRLATKSRNTDHLDKLIAAHSVALNVILVTNNLRDFSAYPDVRLENWLDD